uniref:DCD domain-containing protein n=1 Tax=Steinernema glaseri TaxID=37863 RepID=A0A1I7YJR1_9BILA
METCFDGVLVFHCYEMDKDASSLQAMCLVPLDPVVFRVFNKAYATKTEEAHHSSKHSDPFLLEEDLILT